MLLFNIIKLSNSKGDSVPEYLRGVSLQEIANYYFNWHTDQNQASWPEISQWYAKARGWKWEQD